jgi:dienelactone hydrolase
MTREKFVLAGLLLLILVAVVQTIAAQAVTIPAQSTTGEKLQLPGILHRPSGDGPFPAVVMLCGCPGYAKDPDATQQSTWADRLVGWGYVALQIDSFSSRGFPNGVCDNTNMVDDMMRSGDAFAAKSYLSTLPFIDSKNIAVIGWSHGGWAEIRIIDGYVRDKKVNPFKAAVAFYPYCSDVIEPDTPVLVLIGKKDDWCPAYLAERLKEKYSAENWKPEFSLTVYPNATHAFDFETTPVGGVDFMSHHMEYDPEATSDAIAQTKAFLAKYIGAR